MAIFEIQGPDGKVYEVEAPTIEQAASAVNSLAGPKGGSSVDPQAVSEFRDKGRTLATTMANGASFGFGDNIAGLIEGGKEVLQGRDFGGGYAYGRDMARAGTALDSEANPGIATAGNLFGAAIPALAAAPLTGGGSVLGTMARSGAVGAVEGGLQGAGNADGQDTLGQAVKGSVIGGLAGIAAPAVVAGVGAVKNAVMDPLTGIADSLMGRANVGKANRALIATLRQSGKTEAEIAEAVARAAREGQPEFRMMDALGIAGQRRASGVARAGGDAAAEIQDFLTQRQLDQGDRVGGFVEDAFGFRGKPQAAVGTDIVPEGYKFTDTPSQVLAKPSKSATDLTTRLTDARSATAGKAYDAARGNAAPVDVQGALSVIDNRIGGMQGSGIAGDSIDGKLAGYRARLAGDGAGLGPDVTSAELSDFDRVLGLKQSIQDDIGAAVRAGRNNEARELTKLANELDAALEASSDMYRTANDGFREASRVIEAVDTGAGMAARGRAADNVPVFNAMTAEQQAAARVGYGDLLLNRLEAVTAPTANRAKPLLSTKRVQEADAMAVGPTIYRDRLARENTMWETQNRALGGSRTADNLQDIEAMDGLAGGVLDVARSAGNLQFGDMAAKIGGMLGPLARGQTDETRQLIARALMSDDPVKALAPALRQELSSSAKRRVIEAILRQPMREGGEASF